MNRPLHWVQMPLSRLQGSHACWFQPAPTVPLQGTDGPSSLGGGTSGKVDLGKEKYKAAVRKNSVKNSPVDTKVAKEGWEGGIRYWSRFPCSHLERTTMD